MKIHGLIAFLLLPVIAAASPLTGCYSTDITGLEGGFALQPAANGDFTLDAGRGKDLVSLPMKTATAAELRLVSENFHLALSEGVSMKWPPGTPNQRPVGVYRGRDGSGKDVVMGYFFFGAGVLVKKGCPP